MKSRWGSAMGLVVTLTVVGSAGAFWILHLTPAKKSEAAKTPAPATQTRAVKESDLNVVTLAPEAEKRLGLETAAVAKRKVSRVRVLGGEVVLPPGRAVVVSAAFAGTVQLAAGATAPAPGEAVKRGQAVFTLLPLLTNEARTSMAMSLVDAEGQVKNADVQVRAAEVALARVKQLVADGAGSKRAVDEAQAQYDLGQKTLEAARARRDVLSQTIKGADAGSIAPIPVASPDAGVIRNVQVASGQMVSAGAALFEVVNASRVWVRVPVYVGDANLVATERPATVGRLGGAGARGEALSARPVAAPPSATALNSTVDLFYELDNAAGALSPGQRVGVTLPLKGEDESLIVPWSAVAFDVNGGTWVYENVAPHAYARRRVQVRHVTDGQAVLASGPTAGTVIVTVGVAEVFGKEMGFGK